MIANTDFLEAAGNLVGPCPFDIVIRRTVEALDQTVDQLQSVILWKRQGRRDDLFRIRNHGRSSTDMLLCRASNRNDCSLRRFDVLYGWVDGIGALDLFDLLVERVAVDA